MGDEVEQGQTLSGLCAKDFTLQATITQDSFTLWGFLLNFFENDISEGNDSLCMSDSQKVHK